jgi:hypothetical protein
MGTGLKTYSISLKVLIRKDDPDFLDKIASRIYALDYVEDVIATLENIDEQQTQQAGTSVFSKSKGTVVQHLRHSRTE